jgi:hypothetical protein
MGKDKRKDIRRLFPALNYKDIYTKYIHDGWRGVLDMCVITDVSGHIVLADYNLYNKKSFDGCKKHYNDRCLNGKYDIKDIDMIEIPRWTVYGGTNE